MSKFSGKCDLYDHVMMIGCKGTGENMTEMEKFELFKQRTGGKIYQNKKLILTTSNIDDEIKVINNSEILRKEKINGRWIYFYYGKMFSSLKTLNNYGYYSKVELYIDSLIDLVPYYPYIIAASCSTSDNEYIVISNDSYPKQRLQEPWYKLYSLENNSDILSHYQDELRKELIRVVKEYY